MRTGQMLTELRRSNAAGIHGHQPSRSVQRRNAIMEEVEMTDPEDYIPEPKDEDIWELELAIREGAVDLDDLYGDEFELYPTIYEDE